MQHKLKLLKPFLIISITVTLMLGMVGILIHYAYDTSVGASVIDGDNTVIEFVSDKCYLEYLYVPRNIVFEYQKKMPSDSMSNSANSENVVNAPYIIKCKKDNFAIHAKDLLEKHLEFNICLESSEDGQDCTKFEAEYIRVRKYTNLLCRNSIKENISLAVKNNQEIYKFSCDTDQTITKKEYEQRLKTSLSS